jgi:hypothetical protein
VREPAPPYRNEGPHALWHVSEDPSLRRFEPHVAATAAEAEPLVWAIDTRHLPLYWFPRDCPRGTFWAHSASAPEDVRRLLGEATRVHVVEDAWLPRMREARLYAYRFPGDPFEPHPAVGGYWVAREPVAAEEVVALRDPVELHAAARIELRALPNLWPLWNEVAGSTLEYSGIRLRNADPMLTP